MPEILAAIHSADLANLAPIRIRKDLEERFKKAMINDLRFNLPAEFEYVAAADSLPVLEERMDDNYESGVIQSECSLVRIKLTVEVELVSHR